MILTGNWQAALIESTVHLATLRGDDPDDTAALTEATIAAATHGRDVDDSGYDTRADRDRDRFAVDYDAEMDRYERGRG